jgi:hypothetical protein
LRRLYNLQPTYEIETRDDAANVGFSFLNTVDMISLRLDIGAGPDPVLGGGSNTPFFSIHALFPAVKVKTELPRHSDEEVDLPQLSVTIRLYLRGRGKTLEYGPAIEFNLLDSVDRNFHFPDPSGKDLSVNLKDRLKPALEEKLYKLQVTQTSPSKFGDFLAPWLVGGRAEASINASINEIFSIGYAPGPA